MAEEAERYCSDCAWPYECAAERSCHRRDMGEVRGEDLARSSDGSPLSSGARCARPDAAAPAQSLVGGETRQPVMVTMTNPGEGVSWLEEARRRYEAGDAFWFAFDLVGAPK